MGKSSRVRYSIGPTQTVEEIGQRDGQQNEYAD